MNFSAKKSIFTSAIFFDMKIMCNNIKCIEKNNKNSILHTSVLYICNNICTRKRTQFIKQ